MRHEWRSNCFYLRSYMEDSVIGGEIGYMKGKESENHSFKIRKAQESLKIPNIAYKICRDKSGIESLKKKGDKGETSHKKGTCSLSRHSWAEEFKLQWQVWEGRILRCPAEGKLYGAPFHYCELFETKLLARK